MDLVSASQTTPPTGSTNFRLGVLARVNELVTEAQLDNIPELCEIILSVMDTIHHYTEEGVRLFPELLVTTSLDPLVESIAHAQFVQIGQLEDINAGIPTAVKRCAPLAIGGWVIAIECQDAHLRYGVITVETSELSPSVYRHAVGDLSLPETSDNVIYIRGLVLCPVNTGTCFVDFVYFFSKFTSTLRGGEHAPGESQHRRPL